MNQHTIRADIQSVIDDGINRVIRSLVRENKNAEARLLCDNGDRIRAEICERLQTSFSIRRPKKR